MRRDAGLPCWVMAVGFGLVLVMTPVGAQTSQAPQLPPAGGTPAPSPGPDPAARPGIPMPRRSPMPPRDPGVPTASGTAVLRGRVIAADTGQPLRRATLRLMSGSIRDSRAMLTDGDGIFEFRDLPAGRYSIVASKSGYVFTPLGGGMPGAAGRPIELADGQRVDKLQIAMMRGGVIIGRVFDELGEPLTEVFVSAQQYRFVGGRRRLVPAGRGDQSNDIGQFRIFGLAPGEYYVTATLRGPMGGMEAVEGESTGYAPTYYPGTADLGQAQRVTVAAGDEVTADMQLVPVRVTKISGVVVDSAGKPVATGMLALHQKGDSMMPGPRHFGRMGSDGSFTISGVTPGTYDLVVRTMPGEDGARAEFAQVPLAIGGDDVTGLRVGTTKGARLSGQLVYEGGPPPNEADIRIALMPADLDSVIPGPSGPGRVTDGRFVLDGVFGDHIIRVMPPKGWMLKSVLLGGRDVTDKPIEIRDPTKAPQLRVGLTNRVTSLTGSVTDGTRLVSDYEVLVFSEDRDKWRMPGRGVHNARADQQGVFKIPAIPPGDYFVIALSSIEPDSRMDPEFFERVSSLATAVTVAEGESRTLSLKLSALTPSP
jgi:Carboxypeptidase regulatory-like domain